MSAGRFRAGLTLIWTFCTHLRVSGWLRRRSALPLVCPGMWIPLPTSRSFMNTSDKFWAGFRLHARGAPAILHTRKPLSSWSGANAGRASVSAKPLVMKKLATLRAVFWAFRTSARPGPVPDDLVTNLQAVRRQRVVIWARLCRLSSQLQGAMQRDRAAFFTRGNGACP